MPIRINPSVRPHGCIMRCGSITVKHAVRTTLLRGWVNRGMFGELLHSLRLGRTVHQGGVHLANFRELRKAEVRRILLLVTRVNKMLTISTTPSETGRGKTSLVSTSPSSSWPAKTIITFCKAVVTTTAQATPTGP